MWLGLCFHFFSLCCVKSDRDLPEDSFRFAPSSLAHKRMQTLLSHTLSPGHASRSLSATLLSYFACDNLIFADHSLIVFGHRTTSPLIKLTCFMSLDLDPINLSNLIYPLALPHLFPHPAADVLPGSPSVLRSDPNKNRYKYSLGSIKAQPFLSDASTINHKC